MDPRTGDFALVGGEPYWRRPLDVAWILGAVSGRAGEGGGRVAWASVNR